VLQPSVQDVIRRKNNVKLLVHSNKKGCLTQAAFFIDALLSIIQWFFSKKIWQMSYAF